MEIKPDISLVPSIAAVQSARRNGSDMAVDEIYLDGKLKKAEFVSEDDKSFGIFMHSLILSNYAEVMKVDRGQVRVKGDEIEKAIFSYTASKGFDKKLIESIAPKVDELSFECDDSFKVSTHMINEKMRIISKGTPDELLTRCSYILLDSRFVKVTRRICSEVSYVLREMLKRCQSVYAIAIKDISKMQQTFNADTYVSEMALVALVGMNKK